MSHSRGPQKGHKLTRAAFARKMGIRKVYLDVLLEVRINGLVITYENKWSIPWGEITHLITNHLLLPGKNAIKA